MTLTIGKAALSPALAAHSESAHVSPLPIVLLRRSPVSMRALGVLQSDSRVELLVTDELSAEWCALAQRVAGLLVISNDDNLGGLVYAVTAGIRTPIVVGLARRSPMECRTLMAAGATACLTLPVTRADLDELLPVLRERAGLARIDPTLRLLLDPIARVARYQDQVARLSQREFALLHYLSSRHGRPVAAEELLTHVWGEGQTSQRTRQILDVYIHQLRKKLEAIGLRGAIATVRLFGYSLVQVTGESSTVNGAASPH